MDNLKYTEILKLNKELADTVNGKLYKINVLSNVTVNSFKDILEYFLRINGLNPNVELGNYDNVLQDSIIVNDKDLVIVMYEMLNIADGVGSYFEGISEELYTGLFQKLTMEIDMIFENLKAVPSVIFNTFSTAFFVPDFSESSLADKFVSGINSYVANHKPANVTLINIDKVVLQCGVKQAFDSRFYQSSKAPYTIAFFKNYCSALLPVILRNTGKLKKAVIFDCDNTLWKGILGEDGPEGIDMSAASKAGRDFNMVQQIAAFLSRQGIIIGICSKNNPEDVNSVLSTHKDMILKDEFIVIKKVNWEDKASNLKAIASELNIGLDSLVFVDDSNFEINLIREQLPEVLALQVPVTGYAEFLQANLFTYFNLVPTNDDAKKTEMYKQQFQREQAKGSASSLEDYLASLHMEIEISEDNPAYIPRIAQLTQKTNQFNLTTKRYTESQIEMFMQSRNAKVVALSAKDKFGDNGLTGTCIITVTGNEAVIDTLLLSCRIIGRSIETAFLNDIITALKTVGVGSISASFIPTAKNAQVSYFYEKMGFAVVAEDAEGTKQYSLDLSAYAAQPVLYISVKNMQEIS